MILRTIIELAFKGAILVMIYHIILLRPIFYYENWPSGLKKSNASAISVLLMSKGQRPHQMVCLLVCFIGFKFIKL